MALNKCKIFGHKYVPYEWYTYEFIGNKDSPYNREGLKKLKSVFCERCGIIKHVTMEGSSVLRFKEPKS